MSKFVSKPQYDLKSPIQQEMKRILHLYVIFFSGVVTEY